MAMETTMIPKAIVFTILYDHICAYDVYFLPYYSICALHVVDILS
jgi:hypothetical protein